jgi:hypothetical protein
MAQQAHDMFLKAGGEWPSSSETLSELIMRRRPQLVPDWEDSDSAGNIDID